MKKKLFPQAVRIEASSLCQLQCRCCPHTKGVLDRTETRVSENRTPVDSDDYLNPWSAHERIPRKKAVGSGFLTFANFKKIIDENPAIRRVELSNWGEMFLNPQLINIMAYAHERGVMLTADNGVNLNTVDIETLEALVKYKFLSLSCSINAATNQIYKQYSVGGDLEIVLDNIRKINTFKRKYHSALPLLHWQFVIFGHNEHEINDARAQAKQLGMYFVLRFNMSDTYSPVVNNDFVRRQVLDGYASRAEYFKKKKKIKRQKFICSQLWNTPQINWDGRVLGCCVNYWDDFGNIFESGLEGVLNNEKMVYARQMLLGKKDVREDILCSPCIYYKIMQDTENWLRMPEVYFYRIALRLKYECIRCFKCYPLPAKYTT